jgi:LPS sulfotransferase NodH
MMTTGVKGYAICTEARSGSNFLCQLLASTGNLGRPLEYFNHQGRRVFDDPHYPADPDEQLDRALTQGATSNGVYGLKILSRQFGPMAAVKWTERLPGLQFIHLQRRDVLGQAISLVRAEQTGRFRSYAKGNDRAPSYDRQAIARMLTETAAGHARWRAYFAAKGIEALELAYEDIVQDPAGAVSKIASRLGVQHTSVDLEKVDVKVQRDGLTDQWRERFIRESADCHHLPDLPSPHPSRLPVSTLVRAVKLLRR